MPQRLSIVPFTAALAPHFYALNKEWLEAYFLLEPYDIQVLQNPQEMVLDPGGKVFFGKLGDDVVATFALTPRGEGVVELNKMAVRKDCRGLGFGHQLLEFAIQWCREREFRMLELYSSTRLDAALHLYLKFGFVEVAVPADCVYDRADIRMQRVLD